MRPATVNEERHTDEDTANARLPSGLVRQPAFVRLEAREAYGHFRDDARHDCTEPFVQRKRRLALHNPDASRDDTTWLRLPRCRRLQRVASVGSGWVHTPSALPDLESCMRTLMVSSG